MKTFIVTIWESAAGRVCPQQRRVYRIVVHPTDRPKADILASYRRQYAGHKVTASTPKPGTVQDTVEWLAGLYPNQITDLRA